MERALRNALMKIDQNDAAARQKVYESAWAAHERVLAATDSLIEEQKQQRRDALSRLIVSIEEELTKPASQDFGDLSLTPRRDDEFDAIGTVETISVGAAVAPDARFDEEIERPSPPRESNRKSAKKRSFLKRLFLPALVIAGCVFVGYSFYTSMTGGAPSSAGRTNSHAPLKDGETSGGTEWVNVFTPADVNRLSVHGKASVSVVEEGHVRFLKITSPSSADGVTFDIGEGVLQRFAGKSVAFDIVARSGSEQTTQMSVTCDFGAATSCARRRFDVRDMQADLLFEVAVPTNIPSGGGTLTIVSDMADTGKSVEILAIRIAKEQ